MDIVQGGHFRAVDAAPAPHGLLATFDAVAAREGVRRLKQRGLDLLAVAAGQRLLDIGCETGNDVRALASVVGPGGLIVGVEPSAVLLAEARRRAADSPLPLHFTAGDASALPLLPVALMAAGRSGSFSTCRTRCGRSPR